MGGSENDEWFTVLERCLEDEFIGELLLKHGITFENGDRKQFGSSTMLYNYYQDGISLTFIDGKLDSIDFFVIDSKFKKVKESVLPLTFSLGLTGKEILEKFGEPIEKGGGFAQKMDVWLRWDKLQVDLNDRSWETAKNSQWKSLTIFQPKNDTSK